MDKVLTALFRIGAWLSAGFACLNGGIVILDGLVHSGRLQMQYQLVTIVAGLMFGLLGAGIFGLERSLTKIYRFQADPNGQKGATELVMSWRVVHLVLGVVLISTFALMVGAVIAIIGRLQQGFTIFG